MARHPIKPYECTDMPLEVWFLEWNDRLVKVFVVDGANVVGSVLDGWWRDWAAAAARLHTALKNADLSFDLIVLVLEGKARAGVPDRRARLRVSPPSTRQVERTTRSSHHTLPPHGMR